MAIYTRRTSSWISIKTTTLRSAVSSLHASQMLRTTHRRRVLSILLGMDLMHGCHLHRSVPTHEAEDRESDLQPPVMSIVWRSSHIRFFLHRSVYCIFTDVSHRRCTHRMTRHGTLGTAVPTRSQVVCKISGQNEVRLLTTLSVVPDPHDPALCHAELGS